LPSGTAVQALENVAGAWVQDQSVVITNGKITEYRVALRVTFVLNE